jgi:UDP-N-acetylmuramoyl-L-alanyl-D-glutamate--2,6-diaminopimelate ligase
VGCVSPQAWVWRRNCAVCRGVRHSAITVKAPGIRTHRPTAIQARFAVAILKAGMGHTVPLGKLVEALPGVSVRGTIDLPIYDIAYDSRQVSRGSLFVAVPAVGGGPETGGMQHVAQAVQRGAVAVVAQSDAIPGGITAVRTQDARAALADLACAYYGHPSDQINLFAVTGTDGKTTTTYLLDQIFERAGYKSGLIGTVETKLGTERVANLDRMTTPESLDVQRLLRRMVSAGVTHVALEASSHALALDRLRGCRFAACGVTNITADHIEFHGSWEAYFSAKTKLFVELSRGRPAILNRDDSHFRRLESQIHSSVVTYGCAKDADVQALDLEVGPGGSQFTLRSPEEEGPVHFPLRGRFNVSNALAASALALSAGVPVSLIADALSGAKSPPGRLERIELGQSFSIFIDYAHTMNAFRSVLSSMREHTSAPKRLIAVFGATGDRDRGKRPILAQLARRYADFFIITNEDPYSEEAEEIISQVAAGLPLSDEGSHFVCRLDRYLAIEEALKMAEPGDTVVILGKGHEQSMVVNGRKETWSDAGAVRSVLASLG